MNRQAAGGQQTVSQGLVLKNMHDLIATANQFGAQTMNPRPVEALAQIQIRDLDSGLPEIIPHMINEGAGNIQRNTRLSQADEHGRHGSIDAFDDAEDADRIRAAHGLAEPSAVPVKSETR